MEYEYISKSQLIGGWPVGYFQAVREEDFKWPAPIYWGVGGIFWIALLGRKDFTDFFEFWYVKWKCNSEAGNF